METATPLAQRVLRMGVRQRHARWVEFSVTDAGGGIGPEVAARLFTPFFSTRAEGMGLGLSLCRTVVEQHGGALEFESPVRAELAPGACPGTLFRFTLPAA
jgi:two-component system sensor histidine kinase DctS